MFGMSHCVYFRCAMNGLNTLAETDRAPVHLCPVCHKKIAWNIGFKPEKRYSRVRAFYEKHGLEEQARWIGERTRRWKLLQQQNSEIEEE